MVKIKLRAWDFGRKEMIYDIDEIMDWNIEDGSPFVSNGAISSDWFRLMRYTGLEDKNGKDIYEGDILKCFNKKMSDYDVGEVVMSGLGCWSLKIDKYALTVPLFEFISGMGLVKDYSNIEIIGNIYQDQ